MIHLTTEFKSVDGLRSVHLLTQLMLSWLISAGLSACTESKPAIALPRPIKTVTVHYETLASATRYSGEVRPRYETQLAFQVGGKLVKRLVDIGSPVKRGQLLATLDQTDVRLDETGSTAQLAAAQAELAQARKDLNHLLNLYNQQLASQAAVDKRQDQVRTAEAHVAAARASQGSYARKSAYAELTAEYDGVITAVEAESGQIVAAGQIIVKLAQPQQQEVVISVPENRLRDVQTASVLKVNLWAKPERFYRANIREISPGVDDILRTFTVKVAILDADADIGMGMTATVHVQKNQPQPIAKLPLTALTQVKGEPSVWIFDATKATVEPRNITLEHYDNEFANVLAGINEGEYIVSAGVHKLMPGQQVRLLGDKP